MTLEQLRAIIKAGGLRGAGLDLSLRLVNRVVGLHVIQIMTLTMETVDPEFLQREDRYEYLFLDETSLRRFAEDPRNDISIEFLVPALKKGDRCFAILENGVLANYGWYSLYETDAWSDLRLGFDPHWIYMYKGFTLPAYRGRRLHAASMAMALSEYAQTGYRGIVSWVEANNFSSLKSVQRLGYVDAGKVIVLGSGDRRWIHIGRGARALGVTLRPVLPGVTQPSPTEMDRRATIESRAEQESGEPSTKR